MIKPEEEGPQGRICAADIPPDAMYAAWKCMNAGMTLNDAIAAALNAWPGMRHAPEITPFHTHLGLPERIFLPLKESTNDR